MTTTLRALIFGAAVAATMTLTLDTVTAAEPQQAVRLEGISVNAHRDAFDADGNLKVTRLEAIQVIARKSL